MSLASYRARKFGIQQAKGVDPVTDGEVTYQYTLLRWQGLALNSTVLFVTSTGVLVGDVELAFDDVYLIKYVCSSPSSTTPSGRCCTSLICPNQRPVRW